MFLRSYLAIFWLFLGIVCMEEDAEKRVPSDGMTDKRNAMIQEAVKSLLGMKELPLTAADRRERTGRGALPAPPKYMLQLYNSYKSGHMPEEKRKGNTVRSILPMRGKIAGDDVLVFNLTGVHPLEQIIQGELHLFKRKRLKSGKRQRYMHNTSGLRLQLFNFTDEAIPLPTYVDVPVDAHGWQSYNVTQAVTSCRQADHNGPHLLGVKLEAQRPNGRYKYLPLGRVVKLNSQPFLIVFSEDRVNQTVEDDFEEYVDLEGEGLPPMNYSFIQRSRKRSKRSLLDNELPDDPVRTNQIPKTGPEMLLRVGEKHRKIDPGIIPYPSKLKKKPFMQQEQNKDKRKRKNRRIPQSWQHKQHSNDANEAFLQWNGDDQLQRDICQRKKLVVDFTDLGWSEWIIAPKSFEAYYCSGHCVFPLSKRVRPSNHAIIQMLIQVTGLHPDVPAPCCVPDSTSSLTLLYFDGKRNVILKNYPNMIVDSCACR